jgi:hypothetical protein
MRQEKKYTFSITNLSEVKKNIQDSVNSISKSYEDRYVNSLYFDSYDYLNYEENLGGLSNRSKARLRWYSKKPFLNIDKETNMYFEIKIKRNLFGSKLIHKFKFSNDTILFDNYSIINYLRKILPLSFLPYIDHCSIMSLGVSYEREYFETYTKNLRLTIDKNIKFIRPNFFDVFNFKEIETYNLDYGVLELKFLKNMSNEVRNIMLDCVSISSGRHSKYSVGINLINK